MRCFIAIELPEDVRSQLGALQERFGHRGKAVRWVRPDAMHLTLKFLGEVPDARLPAVCDALSEVASPCEPFEFAVRRTGCFPPRGGVRVVWAGVEEPTEHLLTCQALCEDAMEELGFAREHRPYVPHLTLGRVKDPRGASGLRELVAECEDFEAGWVDVDRLVLMESHLSPKGAEYTVAHHADLTGG